jgi:hypothetical protein
MFIRDGELQAAFTVAHGFHRADWNTIRIWIERNVAPPDHDQAWNEAALLWVEMLRDDLGGNYVVRQSRQTILLCDQDEETAGWLLEYAGRAVDGVKQHLREVAWGGALTRDVLLVFSDEDDYYQYVSHHCPDGEQAASGGMCIHSEYTHIAMPWHDALDAANTVVHELTHGCLAHLSLPAWLNEGVALTLQRLIAPPSRAPGQGDQQVIFTAAINWNPPMMWDELAERHFEFWNEKNIQSFWAGTSFYEPGDSNALSYSLAEVLVKLLSERGDAAAFRSFLQAAQHDDAGQSAALDILSADLGEIAGTFLGEGEWRPKGKAMVAAWDSAGWNVPPENRSGG